MALMMPNILTRSSFGVCWTFSARPFERYGRRSSMALAFSRAARYPMKNLVLSPVPWAAACMPAASRRAARLDAS
jgi:hypothetical protein